MRGPLFIGIAATAALCSGACSAQQLKSCFPARAINISGAWAITRVEQTKPLHQWDCLESGDLVSLAEGAPSGMLELLYRDGRVPQIYQKECPSRSQCADAYRVDAMQASPPSSGAFSDSIEFFESFFQRAEPKPVAGITRGPGAPHPSVLCPSADGTLDLSTALSGAASKFRVRFLPVDANAAPSTEFELRLDVDHKLVTDGFNLAPGLYLMQARDRDDMPEGKAYALIAAPAECAHLRQAFELAEAFTGSLPNEVSAQAILDFQSVYLQALALDPASAPTHER
jgi:hypothetical protein